jgi:hypothetical protein
MPDIPENDSFDEAAATRDATKMPNLDRLHDLVTIAAEIVGFLSKKTNNPWGARFVAAMVRGSLDYWQSN